MRDENVKKILLVEDEVITSMTLKSDLENCGYKVFTAHTVANAIETFRRENDIDLVLMDIALGDNLDGTDVALIMLGIREIPIIFLSGHTGQEIVGKTEKVKSYGFVVKDSGISVLDANIKTAFRLFNDKSYYDSRYAPGRGENGSTLKMPGNHRDIAGIREIQEALQKSEEKYRQLVENSHDIIYTLNFEGVFTFVSPSWTIFLGHSIDQVVGHPFQPFVHPDDVPGCMAFLKKVIHEGERQEGVEYRVRHVNGTWRWHTSSAVPLRDENGSIYGYEGIARDITERKLAEDKIKSLLAEKELILKEVHHRIRNNMNTICGLILLQIYTIKDESAISALRDTERRINGMMLLYDKLYRSENINEISVADYIPALVDEIIFNFPNSGKVKTDKRIDDFRLSAKKLQSLGIIINELLTNIMKYAFTDREAGLITVSARLDVNNVIFTIADNGAGIPQEIDFGTSTGFGMQLVYMLTTQLRGNIRIERHGGTRFVLEFEA